LDYSGVARIQAPHLQNATAPAPPIQPKKRPWYSRPLVFPPLLFSSIPMSSNSTTSPFTGGADTSGSLYKIIGVSLAIASGI